MLPLTTAWTVRSSKPGEGKIFHIRRNLLCDLPKLTGYRESFPAVECPQRGYGHPPQLAARLNKT